MTITDQAIQKAITESKNRFAINNFDYQYHGMLEYILECGEGVGDRTGTGTISVFGNMAKFDLRNGFPLITTKKVWFKGIVSELLWLISGQTNIFPMLKDGVHIWDEWTPAYKRGGKEEVMRCFGESAPDNPYIPWHPDLDLGSVYGAQWRAWPIVDKSYSDADGDHHIDRGEIDQLRDVIERIKTNPDCRRLIVSAWNVAEIPHMALPPCHCFFQFKVYGDRLDLMLYQRSCDVFLGVPFNIASYALLLEMVAQVTGKTAGVFTHVYGDLHIYNNHMEQVKEQLSRDSFAPPKIKLNPDISNIDDFTMDDIELIDYYHHDTIKAEVSV